MKNKIIGMAVTGGLLLALATTTIVSGADAGSTSDPLVTKSYVDAKINDLIALINTSGTGNGSDNSNTNTGTTANSDAQYKVVAVPKGSSILGGEGTELILRSGKATVVSTTSNGLVNMTTGVDALSGTDVPKNNLMIVPRQDGRGLKITADGANVMVRGHYEIVQ